MTYREVEKILKTDGWYQVGSNGSHNYFKHETKQGKLTVPKHGSKDLKQKTLSTILKQAGLK